MTMKVRLFCIYFRKGGGGEKNNHVILLMIIYLKYIMNNYIAI
jgi:hypothetical protein